MRKPAFARVEKLGESRTGYSTILPAPRWPGAPGRVAVIVASGRMVTRFASPPQDATLDHVATRVGGGHKAEFGAGAGSR